MKTYSIEDVKKASSQKLFTVISLFAGGGGSSTGYRLAGGDVLAINEFVEEAIRTYSLNFPDTKILNDDIRKLSGQDFLNLTGLKVGELDILDGSPPCSAYSLAGKREKNWKGATKKRVTQEVVDDNLTLDIDEYYSYHGQKNYSDGMEVEAIEDLFLDFIRIAKDIQPKVIIAENVKGITFGESKKKLHEFINKFTAIGYTVTYKVLSAADYGVPQARERTIFICIRDDIADRLGYSMFGIGNLFPEPTVRKHVSLREAFEGLVNDPEQEKELFDYVEKSFQKKFIELLPFNPSKAIKPSDIEFIKENPKRSCFNMIRPSLDLPCPTVTQQGQQKGVSGVFHPSYNRKLTIPELKRVMGLPDNFQLTGNFDKQAERLGRMVCPPMMAEIARSIYEKILKPYKELSS